MKPEELLELKVEHNARLRRENHRLRQFIERLLNPEDFGWSVQPEVRRAAKQVLEDVA